MLAKQNSHKTQTASAGHGPLWQRDYRAQLDHSTLTPEEIVMRIRTEFPTFSPVEAAGFTLSTDANTPLEVGDEMQVEIRGAGVCSVRVAHINARSITLRTLDGHIEAGRITFGAYYDNGKQVIRVCSRARSGSRRRHVAYLLFGHLMQKTVWQIFIRRLAAHCGDEEVEVQTQTEQVKGNLADLGELDTPTFVAQDRN